MKQNLGYADRFIRLLAGAILIVTSVAGVLSGVFGIISLVAGIIIMVTSIIGFCPIYTLLNINTCNVKQKV